MQARVLPLVPWNRRIALVPLLQGPKKQVQEAFDGTRKEGNTRRDALSRNRGGVLCEDEPLVIASLFFPFPSSPPFLSLGSLSATNSFFPS